MSSNIQKNGSIDLKSQEHVELIAAFERCNGGRKDKEEKRLWSQGRVFQSGDLNQRFLDYRNGYCYGKAVLAGPANEADALSQQLAAKDAEIERLTTKLGLLEAALHEKDKHPGCLLPTPEQLTHPEERMDDDRLRAASDHILAIAKMGNFTMSQMLGGAACWEALCRGQERDAALARVKELEEDLSVKEGEIDELQDRCNVPSGFVSIPEDTYASLKRDAERIDFLETSPSLLWVFNSGREYKPTLREAIDAAREREGT